MLTGRYPIPDAPGWFVGKLERGFDPDRGGEYTDVHLQVDDSSAPTRGVGPSRVIVFRVPGRHQSDGVLEAATAKVYELIRGLTRPQQATWVTRWAFLRVSCELCKEPGSRCVCPDGPHTFPGTMLSAVEAVRAEIGLE